MKNQFTGPQRLGNLPSWWFQIFLMFTPKFGDDFQSDSYFSNGLKPPTSYLKMETSPSSHQSWDLFIYFGVFFHVFFFCTMRFMTVFSPAFGKR